MSAVIARPNYSPELVERVVVQGDLAKLSAEDRIAYYRAVCASIGLNPLTRPLEYISLNNKLVLYAKRDATDQLRKLHGVSIAITAREKVDDLYMVTAQAKLPDGRTDESMGAVHLAGLKGDALANQILKCETKAKRRVTLSICGLGMLDETEVASVKDARPVNVDPATGEIIGQLPPGVHKPTDGAEQRVEESRRSIVMDCVTAAKDCLDADNIYGAYEVLSGLTDPDEKVWAWTFFDSKQRGALKKQAQAAKEEVPA